MAVIFHTPYVGIAVRFNVGANQAATDGDVDAEQQTVEEHASNGDAQEAAKLGGSCSEEYLYGLCYKKCSNQ